MRVPPAVLATSAPVSATLGPTASGAALREAADVLPALRFRDAFQLPYICPAVEVLVDEAGRPVDPPPPTEKKPPPGELPPPAPAAPPVPAALQALAERQHVDPLQDYSRLLAATASALRAAKRQAPPAAMSGGAGGPGSHCVGENDPAAARAGHEIGRAHV